MKADHTRQSERADEALCTLAASGDRIAEEALVMRYHRLVRICARPYFLAGGDSEDLIQEGMVDEGMRLVEAVRDRYDGERRNPWNEMECGSNYARSMAAFALLPAFSGMTYDLSRGLIGFAPVVPGDFRCFWSLDTGFGTVELSEGEAVLRILYGSLPVRRLRLPVRAAAVEAAGRPIGFTRQDQDLLLEQAVTLRAGEALRVV